MNEQTSEDPDRGILKRVAEGDTESFGVLVERHQERLFNLCLRMLGDREEAREATQEALMKAFRGAGTFKPRGQVYTWLYRIAANHCLNRLRRRRLVRFFGFGDLGFGGLSSRNLSSGNLGGGSGEGRENAEWDPRDEAPDPARRLEDQRRWQRAQGWIEDLPAGQRAVLVLARFEGLSYLEIAETLNISLGAVESRLFRAMRTLNQARESLEGPG